ncbi:HNH endonuclease signature motif containing protein [Streptomyces yaizuensis]|uniref:HNH endonuclease n=1 Tax=Streptomyces yaizuensis TaxID=2989713 RepID=A0ABQ5NTC0_9ACTN|nr:HNH endonuclease [Streptomyces sp. YSPA8]GLF93502.1 HNH endonuclease [Streptomyces sp. YSPA8]
MGRSPWTHERLSEAAGSSRTLSEALTRLGVDPKGPSRRYLHDRMRRLGISTDHFAREGARWTREVLESAVAESTSVCEVLRRLGIEVVGGQHTHISRRIRAYGIDTAHFTAARRTEGPTHERRRLSADEILIVDGSDHPRRRSSHLLRRALLERGAREVCALCGTPPEWQGRPLPLEIDHIDGDWRDNRQENLRFLCPNCHSTTDTYRGRGSGQRRGPIGPQGTGEATEP